jgi:hypothetical protein
MRISQCDDCSCPAGCPRRSGVLSPWLGVDDRTKRSGVVWRYEQTRDGRSYGVTVRIEGVAPWA